MARYNCPEQGCNVYFDKDLESITISVINHAFGSHGKIIDRETVVGIIKDQVQVESQDQQGPASDKDIIRIVRKKHRRRKKQRHIAMKDQIKIESEIKKELGMETKNKIFDWWGKKK